MSSAKADRTRKVKPYPATPPESKPPFEYVPRWRDYLPDLARAMLLAAGVAVFSVVATLIVLGYK